MFGFFKKNKSKQNKSKIQNLIDECGYEQAVRFAAGSIIEKLPERDMAYEFMLQELEGASMGNENSKRVAAKSGIPPSRYKGALNRDVPAIELAQDHITNYAVQLAADQELMARFRVDIGIEVMKHFELGRFTPKPVEPQTFGDDEDFGPNFLITPTGFKVTDRDTGDTIQADIKDGMFHGTVSIRATGMSAGLAPWPLHSNPFQDDNNFCGNGNSPAGPWRFSITPSVPFEEILEQARVQQALPEDHQTFPKDKIAKIKLDAAEIITSLVREKGATVSLDKMLMLVRNVSANIGEEDVNKAGAKVLAISALINVTAYSIDQGDIEMANVYCNCGFTAFDKYVKGQMESFNDYQADALRALQQEYASVTKEVMEANSILPGVTVGYRLAAKQGDASAQFNLGVMYANGDGVPQDYTEAEKWYRLAAKQGNADAQSNLGVMYADGKGVPQDPTEAEKWYRLAAQQGVSQAQYNLGLRYYNGDGVPQDYTEAEKWYRLAAKQGNADAQYNLGFMYANEQGVPQDYAEAEKWYRLAAKQGDANAQSNLGIMYYNGKGVPQDYVKAYLWFNLVAVLGDAVGIKNRDIAANQMSQEQMAQAQKLAQDWIAKEGLHNPRHGMS